MTRSPSPAQGSSPSPVAAGEGLFSLADVVARLSSGNEWPLSSRPSPSPLQSAWVDLISRYDWQWFGTFTFREAVHPEKADKLFRLWCALVDEAHLGKNLWHKESRRLDRLQWVRGLEWQKRGVLHYHALVRNLPAYRDGYDSRQSWASEWERLAGFALLLPVAEIGGAAGYIAKYCAKGGEVDVCSVLSKSPQPRLSGL